MAEAKPEPNLGAVVNLIPNFAGEPPHEAASLTVFLNICNKLVTKNEMIKNLLPDIVRSKLKGKAAEFLSLSLDLQVTDDWQQMQKLLTNRFAKKPNFQVAMYELQAAYMESEEPVIDFYNRVVQIGRLVYEPNNEAQNKTVDSLVLASFVKGLHVRIRNFVQMKEPTELAKALEAAQTCEINMKVERTTRANPKGAMTHVMLYNEWGEEVSEDQCFAMFKANFKPREGEDTRKPGKCNNCGMFGHESRDQKCCFKCKKLGHLRKDCKVMIVKKSESKNVKY